MNQIYYNKKRYTSFILSIILHILILFLLFFALKVHITSNIIFDEPANSQQNAAKVSFANKQISFPSGPIAPIIPNTPIMQAPPAAQVAQVIPNMPVSQNSIKEKNKRNNIQEVIAPQVDNKQNISQENSQAQEVNTKDIDIDNNMIDNKNITENNQEDINSEKENVIARLPGKNIKKTRKNKITAAQIFQAFSNVYRKEQEEQAKLHSAGYSGYNAESNSTNKGSGGTIFSNSDDQERSNVQERADEWKIHLYQNKILRAISQAASLYSKEFYSNEDIDTIVRPKLVIDKNGQIAPISNDQLTGNERIDKEILRFLNAADIPGVPKNFGLNTFIFTVGFKISLKKGINKVYITTGW